MSKILYRLRDKKESLQGKNKIYFSCSPKDFDSCFDLLCEDIFASQNCAVFYESDMEGAYIREELESILQDMQLFIMPVTKNFLSLPSRARDVEYNIAVKYRIPVFPVLIEKGLEADFKSFNNFAPGLGDLQFIDRTESDSTSMSYRERLSRSLASVLQEDNLKQRIRSAFDAYIFVSYRKKDRRQARELMSVIHNIPFCQDIATWYDEFLEPGENWNDNIARAMSKSVLVALAVSPNLAEPENFIIKHEYPDAVKSGKIILPVELEPLKNIDIEALNKLFDVKDIKQRLFSSISAPVSQSKIEQTLKLLLSHTALQGSRSPEHDYLIGLAYLGGVDVDRNPGLAKRMIHIAAAQGLREALKKLADMYRSGDGVEHDNGRAAYWQRKYSDSMRRLYESDKNNENLCMFIESLETLGLYLNESGNYERALKCFNEIYNFHDNSIYFYRSCLSIGSIFLNAQANFDEAEKFYLEAFNSNDEKILLQAHLNLGRIYFARRDFLKSESEYILSGEHGSLTGDIYSEQGDFIRARDFYMKALAYFTEYEDKINLAEIYIKLGLNELNTFNPADSIDWFNKALEINANLPEKNIFALSILYCYAGRAALELGKGSLAEEIFRKAQEFIKQSELILDDINLTNWEAFYEVNKSFCDLHIYRRNFRDAKDFCNEALKVLRMVPEYFKTTHAFCKVYEALGIIEHEQNNYDESDSEARKFFMKALDYTSQNNNDRAAINFRLKNFVKALESKDILIKAQCYIKLGRPGEALALVQLLKHKYTQSVRKILCMCYDALKDYINAYVVSSALVKDFKNADTLTLHKNICEHLADYFFTQGDCVKAGNFAREALKTDRELYIIWTQLGEYGKIHYDKFTLDDDCGHKFTTETKMRASLLRYAKTCKEYADLMMTCMNFQEAENYYYMSSGAYNILLSEYEQVGLMKYRIEHDKEKISELEALINENYFMAEKANIHINIINDSSVKIIDDHRSEILYKRLVKYLRVYSQRTLIYASTGLMQYSQWEARYYYVCSAGACSSLLDDYNTKDDGDIRTAIKALECLSMAHSDDDKLACEACDEALSYSKELALRTKTLDDRKILLKSYWLCGYIHMNKTHREIIPSYTRIHEYYTQALALNEKIKLESGLDVIESSSRSAEFYQSFGSVCFELGRINDAEKFSRKAIFLSQNNFRVRGAALISLERIFLRQ